MRGHELVVDAGEQLVGVEPADHGEDPVHLGISERRVQVGEAVLDGRGTEVVAAADVLAEADTEPGCPGR
jgi:hypothetical protein